MKSPNLLLAGGLAVALLGPGTAHAQTVHVGAAGGYAFATRQPWAGLDVSFHHDEFKGFRFVGRVNAGWAFADNRPWGRAEVGFAGAIQTATAHVRLGLVAGSEVFVAPYTLPLQVRPPDPDGYGAVGFLPFGMAIVEMGFMRPSATRGAFTWSVGAKIGAGLSIKDTTCSELGGVSCEGQNIAFQGGITGRIRFHEGVFLEALAGPSPYLAIGYAFGGPKRVPPEETVEEGAGDASDMGVLAEPAADAAPTPEDVVPEPTPASEPEPEQATEPEPSDVPEATDAAPDDETPDQG